MVDALFELSDDVAQPPLIGRIVPELENPRLRERFLYSYRVLYEINTQPIEIIAIIHGRRLLESISQRFE